jgi:hypothetical protein
MGALSSEPEHPELSAPATPMHAHEMAAALYAQVSPLLGCHNLCQAHALLVLAAATALGLEASLKVEATHCFVEFADGSRSENWFTNIRLVPPQ